MSTPDTFGYMVGGFVVFCVVFFGYVSSLYIRWRNLSQELSMLDEIRDK